jgi:predicted glycoside hydrolase/deacetylase ChbG (UPF0249 family)
LQDKQLDFMSTVSNEALEAQIFYKSHIPSLITNNQILGLGLMGSPRENIELTVPHVETGITEYMVHPGYRQTEGLGDDFSYSQDRETEMNNLKSEWFKQLLVNNNISQTSWKSL